MSLLKTSFQPTLDVNELAELLGSTPAEVQAVLVAGHCPARTLDGREPTAPGAQFEVAAGAVHQLAEALGLPVPERYRPPQRQPIPEYDRLIEERRQAEDARNARIFGSRRHHAPSSTMPTPATEGWRGS